MRNSIEWNIVGRSADVDVTLYDCALPSSPVTLGRAAGINAYT